MKTNIQTRNKNKSLVKQAGSNLIEVLVSILIFAMGILGILGLQASTVGVAADARYRTEAAALADDYIARMMVAPPSTVATDFKTGGTEFNAWQSSRINGTTADRRTLLPNATVTSAITGATDAGQNVLLTISWRAGDDSLVTTERHQHITQTVIPPTPPVP